ncbi:MAG TPA: zinc ABC transporter substrate-binding protein [Alphaproteobacteria bacterium]|nr:zinc ABC transporter substrate-binding protein [Alphaproteobacteria bacterium]
MPAVLRIAAVPAIVAFLVGGGVARAADPPGVVASIAPVHSLVAAVMGGVGTPTLLLKGGASPHTYSLRPSDARALASARLIFWIGEDMERFLVRPLKTLGRKARKIALLEAKGVTVLTVREGGVWAERGRGYRAETRTEGQKHGEHGAHDAHIWLDPRNAKAMAAAIVTALVKADPANAATYRANAVRLAAELDALDRELDKDLAPVRTAPFVVFHDAYQYFERRYRLRAAGAITLDPGRKPGARRLAEIRAAIRAREARCVFAEPQFRPSIVATVTDGTGARAATLDPLGARIRPGADAYFMLMRRMAASLVGCLKAGA